MGKEKFAIFGDDEFYSFVDALACARRRTEIAASSSFLAKSIAVLSEGLLTCMFCRRILAG